MSFPGPGPTGRTPLRTTSCASSVISYLASPFVANLRGLAGSCKFGALQDEIVRDQLIEHTSNPKVRKTLLLEADDLSLSRVFTITPSCLAAADSRLFCLRSNAATPGASLGSHPFCANCGSQSRASRAPSCPVRGQSCVPFELQHL